MEHGFGVADAKTAAAPGLPCSTPRSYQWTRGKRSRAAPAAAARAKKSNSDDDFIGTPGYSVRSDNNPARRRKPAVHIAAPVSPAAAFSAIAGYSLLRIS